MILPLKFLCSFFEDFKISGKKMVHLYIYLKWSEIGTNLCSVMTIMLYFALEASVSNSGIDGISKMMMQDVLVPVTSPASAYVQPFF